jgi:hypothetical protein
MGHEAKKVQQGLVDKTELSLPVNVWSALWEEHMTQPHRYRPSNQCKTIISVNPTIQSNNVIIME